MKSKEINVKFLEGLLISMVAVFTPIKAVICITILLVLVDTITGILAARKRKEKISSAGLRRTVSKLAVYLTAVCLGFLVEHYMIEDILPISKIISGVISLVELKSVLENMDSIQGSSLFKAVIQKLGSINDLPKDEEKKDGQS